MIFQQNTAYLQHIKLRDALQIMQHEDLVEFNFTTDSKPMKMFHIKRFHYFCTNMKPEILQF
ncbi:hypothetical protein Hanom_Chr07g00625301 [Helianthus anomalus]